MKERLLELEWALAETVLENRLWLELVQGIGHYHPRMGDGNCITNSG